MTGCNVGQQVVAKCPRTNVGLAVTEHSDLEEPAEGSEAHYGDAEERPGCRDLLDVGTARACSL